jgi:membrane protein DedA with SNARE-associated domain
VTHPLVTAAGVAAVLLLVLRRRSLEPTLKAGAALVAVGCLLVGFGAVPLPNVEAIIEEIGKTLGTWTYLFVAVFAFLETGAFVGLIAPGETVVLVGGVVAGQGRIDLLTLIGITWASAVAGDVCSMLLGRKLGREFLERHGHRVAITEERLRHVEGFFDRYGGVTILVGRFLGLVRALAPFLAGASKMPLRRFLPYDIVAAGAWSATFCVLGYLFWHSLDQVTRWAGTGALALGAAVALIVALAFLRRLARDGEFRARVRASVAEKPGGRALLAVVGPVLTRAAGPARFLWHRFTPGQLGLELTTLLALTAVGAFVFVLLGATDTAGLDARAFDVAERMRTGPLTEFATVYTELGSFAVVGPLVLATTIWALLRGRGYDAVALAVGAIALVFAVAAAKDGYGRVRPEDAYVLTDSFAYPSGHAAQAVALIACAVVLTRGGMHLAIRSAAVTVAIVLAIGVAASRVYLRAHFLSDTLGGIGLALAVFGVCGIFAVVIAHLRHNRTPTS